MTRPPRGTPAAAVAMCREALGAERCREIAGAAHVSTVHNWANPNRPETPTLSAAIALDRVMRIEEGMTPFLDLFRAEAGDCLDRATAARLRRMADQLDGGN